MYVVDDPLEYSHVEPKIGTKWSKSPFIEPREQPFVQNIDPVDFNAISSKLNTRWQADPIKQREDKVFVTN